MNVLVLGGTHFIGRHIVEVLLAAAHRVTILTRGQTPDMLPTSVERLRGDRDRGALGLGVLGDRSWDACVDVSGYTPRQVRPSAETLRRRVKRYVLVSAVSVYGDPTDRPVRETHPRVSPAGEEVTEVVGELYGRLKVTCENIVQEVFGDRSALLRPQIVVGPYDLSRRYTFWAERTLRGGEVLAPGDGSDHLQVIDARDLARFVRTVVETGVGGPFNLAGPRLTWADFMVLLGAQNPVWVPAGILGAASVSEFELPLFRPEHGPRSGLMDISNQRAQAAGLTLTAPETTLREVRAWLHGQHLTPLLSPAREAQLILQARVQPSTGREHGRNAGSGEDSGP